MSWWQAVPTFLLATAVFFLPGLGTVLLLRLRGPLALASAPAVSLAIAGLGAIVLALIGVPWNLLSYAAASALTMGAAALVSWRLKLGARAAARTRWRPLLLGMAVALPVSFFPLKAGMGEPQLPALTWDSVFHHSAIRWILDTGNGSSLALGAVASDQRIPRYYPGAWHDLVSLTVLDQPISLAINMTALLMSVLIWPLAVGCLAQVSFPRSRTIGFFAPVVGSGFVAFPARMISYGTVWPTAMATALVPVLIALTVVFFRTAGARGRFGVGCAGLLALAGAALSHPTAVADWLYLTAPFLIALYAPFVWRLIRTRRRVPAIIWGIGPVLLFALGIVAAQVVPALRAVLGFRTTPVTTGPAAFGDAVFDTMLSPLAHGNSGPFWVGGLTAMVGLVLTFVLRQGRTVAVGYAITVLLYVVAAGPDTFLRPLVAIWYSDPVRLGGLVPIYGSVLSAFVLAAAVRAVGHALSRGYAHLRSSQNPMGLLRARSVISAVLAIVLTGGLLSATGGLRADQRTQRLAADYWKHLQWSGGLVSAGELNLLNRIESEIGPNSLVIGDPTSGASLIYAFADREVVFPTMSGTWSADARYLGRNFNKIDSDPRVCQLVRKLGVTHFYDDDNRYLPNIIHRRDMTGLTVIGVSPKDLTLVDEADGARLYKIRTCGLG